MDSATHHHYYNGAFRLVPYQRAIIRQIKFAPLQFFRSSDSDRTHIDIHFHLSSFQQFLSLLLHKNTAYSFSLSLNLTGSVTNITFNLTRSLTIVTGLSIIECSATSASRTSFLTAASAYFTSVFHFLFLHIITQKGITIIEINFSLYYNVFVPFGE